MRIFKRAGWLLLMAIGLLWSAGLTGCWLHPNPPPIVINESKVQKISKGESANFNGWILTDGALTKLLESAEKCQAVKP